MLGAFSPCAHIRSAQSQQDRAHLFQPQKTTFRIEPRNGARSFVRAFRRAEEWGMVSILIIEADQNTVDLYQQVFSQCQTNIFADSQSALQFLRQNEPDLVITDYHLPKGSAARVLTYMNLHPC